MSLGRFILFYCLNFNIYSWIFYISKCIIIYINSFHLNFFILTMNSFPFFTDICILFSLINDICRWACYRLFGFSGRYERLVGFFLFTAIPFPFLFTFFRRSGTLVDGVQVDCTHYFYIFQRRLCYFERSGFGRLFHLSKPITAVVNILSRARKSMAVKNAAKAIFVPRLSGKG